MLYTRLMDAPKRHKVVLALIERDGMFLLIDRMDPHLKLAWAFPGGVVEDGETEEIAVAREAKGETGIDVVIKKKIFERKHPNTFVELAYYHCEPIDKNQEPHIIEVEEIKGLAWVPATEVLYKFTSNVDPVIEKFVLSFTK